MEKLVVKSKAGSLYYNDTEQGVKLEPHEITPHQRRLLLERLHVYEDTGLTPPEIVELKERDTAKEPEVHKNKFSDVYTCPNCALVLINKDEKGWFCGKHYKFCPDCGQRIKWEDRT